MRLHLRLGVVCVVVLGSAAVAEAGQEPINTVTPVVALSFMIWILISALLAANHPSISTTALVCWFLLFFPVSLVLFNGNIEVYLFIWYAYIAVSFVKVLLMKRWIEPERRRFLLEWKGVTFLAVTLFLPWRHYESRWVNAAIDNGANFQTLEKKDREAWNSVEKIHPAPHKLTRGGQALHARNFLIMQGVDFVICWTKDGKASGGTGQALRIAEERGIPVRNLQNPETRKKVETWLSK